MKAATQHSSENQLSIFNLAWNKLNTAEPDRVELYKVYDLLRLIEIELLGTDNRAQQNDLFFLSKDPIISKNINSVIRELEHNFGRFGNELLVTKADMFQLIINTLEDIKIFDYDTMKVYGDFNDYTTEGIVKYYQDNFNFLIEKDYTPLRPGTPNISKTPNILSKEHLEDTDRKVEEESIRDDSDDINSIMEDAFDLERGSPLSFLDSATESIDGLEKSIKKSVSIDSDFNLNLSNTGFQLKRSLDDLQQFYNDLEGKFAAFETDLNELSYQNNHDFKSLITLNQNNNRMLKKVRSIRSEMVSVSCQLQEVKYPGSMEVIENLMDSKAKTTTSLNTKQNQNENDTTHATSLTKRAKSTPQTEIDSTYPKSVTNMLTKSTRTDPTDTNTTYTKRIRSDVAAQTASDIKGPEPSDLFAKLICIGILLMVYSYYFNT